MTMRTFCILCTADAESWWRSSTYKQHFTITMCKTHKILLHSSFKEIALTHRCYMGLALTHLLHRLQLLPAPVHFQATQRSSQNHMHEYSLYHFSMEVMTLKYTALEGLLFLRTLTIIFSFDIKFNSSVTILYKHTSTIIIHIPIKHFLFSCGNYYSHSAGYIINHNVG